MSSSQKETLNIELFLDALTAMNFNNHIKELKKNRVGKVRRPFKCEVFD